MAINQKSPRASKPVGSTNLRADDVTVCLLSQNVRVFGTASVNRADWLLLFKRRHFNGNFDLVLRQETHVSPEAAKIASRDHAHQCGYRVGEGSPTLSYWVGGSSMSAGVDMLIYQRGRLQNVKPIYDDYWSSHLMAVAGTLNGALAYVPTLKTQREAFYARLHQIHVPSGVRLYVGGDLNCTPHGVRGRAYASPANAHNSQEIFNLLDQWLLLDSVTAAFPPQDDPEQLQCFYDEYHTYIYRFHGHGLASSRLDRR
ncbi:unnamed protein product [Phytophthora fragariaefolia]|uniref:Unnamed protein product n=1 Tax=Phytophthora fragariaefolia TaxID=1490495 RepID=A0A9W6WUQ1_9STRA|nr:unnamed protein product [Phytophthora fragariaefolia]